MCRTTPVNPVVHYNNARELINAFLLVNVHVRRRLIDGGFTCRPSGRTKKKLNKKNEYVIIAGVLTHYGGSDLAGGVIILFFSVIFFLLFPLEPRCGRQYNTVICTEKCELCVHASSLISLYSYSPRYRSARGPVSWITVRARSRQTVFIGVPPTESELWPTGVY